MKDGACLGAAPRQKLKSGGWGEEDLSPPCPQALSRMKRYTANETMRSVSFSMIKPLIDDEYEDECYELSYNLHPKMIAIAKQCNVEKETDIVKMFLRDKDLYNMCKQLNDQSKLISDYHKLMFIFHVTRWATKMSEYNEHMQRLHEIKEKYGI
jgi:hypothetical protein